MTSEHSRRASPKADAITVVLLAGGAATRLPGKLALPVDSVPMIVRAFDAFFAAGYPVVISRNEPFPPEIEALLTCPTIRDRWPGGGPLVGALSASYAVKTPRVFVIAGDIPHVGPSVVRGLLDAWRPGDEAAVPEHDGNIEPVAALYDRVALLRAGAQMMDAFRYGMRDAIDRLHARHVPMDGALFANINTPDDWQSFSATRIAAS